MVDLFRIEGIGIWKTIRILDRLHITDDKYEDFVKEFDLTGYFPCKTKVQTAKRLINEFLKTALEVHEEKKGIYLSIKAVFNLLRQNQKNISKYFKLSFDGKKIGKRNMEVIGITPIVSDQSGNNQSPYECIVTGLFWEKESYDFFKTVLKGINEDIIKETEITWYFVSDMKAWLATFGDCGGNCPYCHKKRKEFYKPDNNNNNNPKRKQKSSENVGPCEG